MLETTVIVHRKIHPLYEIKKVFFSFILNAFEKLKQGQTGSLI